MFNKNSHYYRIVRGNKYRTRCEDWQEDVSIAWTTSYLPEAQLLAKKLGARLVKVKVRKKLCDREVVLVKELEDLIRANIDGIKIHSEDLVARCPGLVSHGGNTVCRIESILTELDVLRSK